MKKTVLALALAAAMVGSLTACGGGSKTESTAAPTEAQTAAAESKEAESKEAESAEAPTEAAASGGYELALVTDLGTIDDKSFNQGAWEGLKKYL